MRQCRTGMRVVWSLADLHLPSVLPCQTPSQPCTAQTEHLQPCTRTPQSSTARPGNCGSWAAAFETDPRPRHCPSNWKFAFYAECSATPHPRLERGATWYSCYGMLHARIHSHYHPHPLRAPETCPSTARRRLHPLQPITALA